MKIIKKSLLLCVAALSLGGLSGCDFFTKPLDFTENTNTQKQEEQQQQQEEQQIVHVEDLSITPEELELVIDQEKTISATVLPENAVNKAVTFKSMKESVKGL